MAYHCGWAPATLAATHSRAPCGSLNWLQLLTPIPSESHSCCRILSFWVIKAIVMVILAGEARFALPWDQYPERSCNVPKIMQHRNYLQDSETLRSAIPTKHQT